MKLIALIVLALINTTISLNDLGSVKKVLTRNKSDDNFIVLLDLAWNDTLVVKERYKYALDAYNLALKSSNEKHQFEVLKILGTLALNSGDIDEAKIYSNNLERLSIKLGDYETAGIAYNTLGFIFQRTGQYDSAVINYKNAVEKFSIAGSNKSAAQAMVNVGIIYKNIGFYQDAVEVTLDALRVIEKEKDSASLGSAYNNIGIALKELKNYEQAEYYLKKALEIRQAQNDTEAEAGVLNNLGNVYRNWGKFYEALLSYNESLRLKEKLGNAIQLASTIDNIGEVHLKIGNISQAEFFFKRAFYLRSKVNYVPGIITSSNRLANLFLKKKMLDSAQNFASKALLLSLENKSRNDRLESYRILKLVLFRKEEFKSAFFYAERYIDLYDSLYSEEKAQIIANMEVKYRTEQYVKDLELSAERGKAQQIQIQNQHLLIGGLILALVSILSVTFLVYKNYNAKKKAEAVEKTLRREIQHRVKNNLQLISSMQRLQMDKAQSSEIKKVLQENEDRIQAINLVHQSLYREGRMHRDLDFRKYASNLIANLKESYSWQQTTIEEKLEIDNYMLPTQIANRLGLVLNELLTNAFKYSFNSSKISEVYITLSKRGDKFIFMLRHTNEYWNYKEARQKPGSFGLTLIEMLLEQMNGQFETEISDVETKYSIVIPIKHDLE
ncbi:MAG: tetratricopeptide repeat protein [Bacteroidota bacterium]